MHLKKLKVIFTKHLLIITVIFPLIIILFYGLSVSLALKYKHISYTEQELHRYEQELKYKHINFLKEKARYIDSFMNYVYTLDTRQNKHMSTDGILGFIDSIKKYDSGFIFIFHKNGQVIKHPCGEKLVELLHQNHQDKIVFRLINAAEKQEFIDYDGTDCIENNSIKKIAFVHHIKTTDFYIVISKNEKDIAYSIEQKKKIWEKKLNDESQENIKLLIIVSILSIIFSLIFSKFLNILIRDYEEEIKESNEAMFSQSRLAQAGELISMISHQWRQPISKIASIVANLRFQMMMGKELNLEELDKKFLEIEDYTEFLSETIDDFREFYKPKKEKEATLVLPLIDKSLNFLENEITKKNIEIKKEFSKDIKVLLYQNELIQVIINIVQNAIEFSKKNATITIKTKLKENEYIITIRDEAGGIEDQYINRIFDAHFSTKTSSNSTNLGLGLYVSKVIIEKHFNGKLEVKSEGENTTFTIRLIRDDK